MTILSAGISFEKNAEPLKWSDEELNKWFNSKDWCGGWGVTPDSSINKRALAIAYFKNPERWQKAFEYLKTTDLLSAPPGKTEIEGESLFASVAEYLPKNREEVRYESHEKYIDIQYVISGKELMGITSREKVVVDESYNKEKDITFYTFDGGVYRLATPAGFFIFFPDDMHRPSISTGDTVFVKKVVIKIMID